MTKAIEEAARGGGGFSLEHRIIQPDGTIRWLASHGRSDRGTNGQGFGTRGASIDITARREAAATADLQRQELAHLSRVSSLGVLSEHSPTNSTSRSESFSATRRPPSFSSIRRRPIWKN